jgi:hypothetical protein
VGGFFLIPAEPLTDQAGTSETGKVPPMPRRLIAAAVAACLVAGTPLDAAVAKAPAEWDGLVRVKSQRLRYVYILPGADFTGYTKVMLDAPEMAFQRNWVRDFNRTVRGTSGRLREEDANAKLEEFGRGFQEVWTRALTSAGYQVVTHPGPDVLRIRTAVINLRVNAPNVPQAGRVRTYAPEAGSATLIVEARDSESNQLLGRAADARVAGDMGPALRFQGRNQADFERLFGDWARASVRGLQELKADAPQVAR